MNQLATKEVQMTSVELAEVTGKKHQHIMRDIRTEISSLGDEIGQSIFGQTFYNDSQGRPQPCYKFGRKGAMQLALKYDAKTRYKVIEKLEELEQGQALQAPQTIEDMIILQAQSMKELKADVTENAKKIDKLIDETYVTPEQKNYLQLARNKRVVELIGYRTKAYNDKSFRNRVYAELGRQYKNYFKISSYGYTLKNRYEEAIKLIESYNLSMELSMQLDIINSQKIA
ncbi:MAG: ORF6C domain-containing protein [Vallitalea sp.]|jgi:Rha family phage regulatory protein|nr:ORF6C domain-containing protein [Vallitalea sp.]